MSYPVIATFTRAAAHSKTLFAGGKSASGFHSDKVNGYSGYY
ncbi:hypothetical protein HMPREF0758_1870 [Serratia odorifera DSM 4582]|uniref:Uncharacterized protein n=1 Tax=Serratia odorifera DSM 4582 TaxID=667129 RepID=D4E196_SEROD|nr:hypothetical protein HMPREF0758_1870 [Serratia odorifera DSM 4582]